MPNGLWLRAVLLVGVAVLATAAPAPGGVGPAAAAGDCLTDATLDAEEAAFLGLINNYRAQNNRPPLNISYTLTRAAQWKSTDMANNNYFAHDDLNRSWVTRIRDCGYGFNTYLGENIAAGGATAQQAFNQWKNSPGHNSAMLSSSYSAIGIGRHFRAGSPYGWYWTTDFGGFSDGWMKALDPPPSPSPPALHITSPLPGRSYGGTLTLSAKTPPGTTVAAVDFAVDGVRVRRDARAPYETRLNTRRLKPGSHLITVRAIHADGRITQRSITIETRR